MLITCPKCETVYNIDAALITESGKNVRCAKCGQVFFVAPPLRLDTHDAMQDLPEVPHLDMPASEDVGSFENYPGDSAAFQDENVSPPIDDYSPAAEMPQDFSNPQDYTPPPPPPFQDVQTQTDDLYNEPARSLKNAPPPTQRGEPRSRPSKLHPLFWILVLLNLALLAFVLWSGRFYLVSRYPALKPVYVFLGASFEFPGFGLDFKNVRKDFSKPGLLVLSGEIVNLTDRKLKMPFMKVSFFDAQMTLLHSLSVSPIKEALEPEETMPFLVEIASPPPAAKEVELSFMR